MAQYYGSGDNDGLRYTFRFKFLITLIAAIIGVVVFGAFSDTFIEMFLFESDSSGDLEITRAFGKEYLYITLFGLIPYAISQVYASSLRETGSSILPMVSSVVAVGTNFVLNIILIFGYLGLPALGVRGAAIATVVSRYVELAILVIYAHVHTNRFGYLKGAYLSLRIPRKLFKEITVKGIPLMMNEFLWGIAMTMRNQCYSTRGLDVVATQNISSTIFNLFSVVYMAIGISVSIIVGAKLGAGRIEEAKDTDRKILAFAVTTGIVIMAVMIGTSFFFPKIYNTNSHVHSLATYMMIISGLTMPFGAFANAAYFTLRSGGKVLITIIFDSVYMWAVVMPTSMILAYLTDVNIFLLFAIRQGVDIFKCAFGGYLIKKGGWANVIVADEALKR
jgi:putative MATE family efflux protein